MVVPVKPFNKDAGPVSATNPCRLCSPLGASLAFKGLAGCVPVLHGSQGCATYIRRYMISHYREPVDIASSSFDENTVIFGGKENLFQALRNVEESYNPQIIGIATTCLSETIGDDVRMFLMEYDRLFPDHVPIVSVSTPSYQGAHSDGYRRTVLAIVRKMAAPAEEYAYYRSSRSVNLFPGMVSPAEIRELKSLTRSFGLMPRVLPDYSDTLDGPAWMEYTPLPTGGTTLQDLHQLTTAEASLVVGEVTAVQENGGELLHQLHGVQSHALGYPVGIAATDKFLKHLSQISGMGRSEALRQERGRLVDSYVDAHKYVYGKEVVIAGNEDTVAAMTRFALEIGLKPVLCATGGRGGFLTQVLKPLLKEHGLEHTEIIEDADFDDVERQIEMLEPDIILSSSKAYKISRKKNIPLLRTEFPVHDRFGGQRKMWFGYSGTLRLLDELVNLLLEKKQADSEVGFTYL